jgi:hypothetical protein
MFSQTHEVTPELSLGAERFRPAAIADPKVCATSNGHPIVQTAAFVVDEKGGSISVDGMCRTMRSSLRPKCVAA